MAKTNKPNRDFRAEAAPRNDELAETGFTDSMAHDDGETADGGTWNSQSEHTSAADQIARVAAAAKNKQIVTQQAAAQQTVAQQKSDGPTSPQSKMGNQHQANPPKR